MTLTEYAGLVKNTRGAQQRFFRDRSPQNLRVARDWERRLDEATSTILTGKQPGLFDEPVKEQP